LTVGKNRGVWEVKTAGVCGRGLVCDEGREGGGLGVIGGGWRLRGRQGACAPYPQPLHPCPNFIHGTVTEIVTIVGCAGGRKVGAYEACWMSQSLRH
jgi:hypothetical protein